MFTATGSRSGTLRRPASSRRGTTPAVLLVGVALFAAGCSQDADTAPPGSTGTSVRGPACDDHATEDHGAHANYDAVGHDRAGGHDGTADLHHRAVPSAQRRRRRAPGDPRPMAHRRGGVRRHTVGSGSGPRRHPPRLGNGRPRPRDTDADRRHLPGHEHHQDRCCGDRVATRRRGPVVARRAGRGLDPRASQRRPNHTRHAARPHIRPR